MTSPLLTELHLFQFRNYVGSKLQLDTPVTLISGPNGAGKTSLLEAIHVLASGRSFRTGRHDKLVSHDCNSTVLRASLSIDGQVHQLGMERGKKGLLQLKLNGEKVKSQSQIAHLFPVMALHPGTVDLVESGSEGRRRLYDWLMFHVEHDFLASWKELTAVVKQRNEILKKNGFSSQEIRVWNRQLALTSGRIDQLRQAWIQPFSDAFTRVLSELNSELPKVKVKLFSGWEQGADLLQVLDEKLELDRQRGYTSSGAQRMDLKVSSSEGAVKEVFSRGQKKLVSYALVLAALIVLADTLPSQQSVVVLVDDLTSELDEVHSLAVLKVLASLPHQVVITSLDPELPSGLNQEEQIKVFHVEHGRLKTV